MNQNGPLQPTPPRGDLESYLLEIAISTREMGGSASTLAGYQMLPAEDTWEFPKYPARTVILPPEADLVEGLRRFVVENEDRLREADSRLGTWIHPATGCCYLDITTRCAELEEARRRARAAGRREGRSIVALYNSSRMETVFLSEALPADVRRDPENQA